MFDARTGRITFDDGLTVGPGTPMDEVRHAWPASTTRDMSTGWQWVGLVSPVFVAVLITRVSGVPLLEAKADAKWGGQPDYEEYKRTTPVLVPRLR